MNETLEQPKPKSSWSWKLGLVGLIGVVGAIVVGLIAMTLARYDVVAKLTGFIWFVGAQPIVLVAGAIALLGLVIGLVKKSGPKWPALMALVLAAGMVGAVWFGVKVPAGNYPVMHDITTDVDDPPAFTAWKLREDNLEPFANMEEWRAAHREGYPDIGPIVMRQSPQEALAIARALAEERGWTITDSDPAAGRIEAIAYAGYVRFRDHVVIEVTPIDDGSTRVDMRSTSEVGRSDLGYNAKRIREFLAAMEAA